MISDLGCLDLIARIKIQLLTRASRRSSQQRNMCDTSFDFEIHKSHPPQQLVVLGLVEATYRTLASVIEERDHERSYGAGYYF